MTENDGERRKMQHPQKGAIEQEILAQAQILMLVIGQKKRGVPMETNSVIFREAVGNLINTMINKQIGQHEKLGAKPVARFMSKKFFIKWSQNPIQSNLRKVGVYEHRTPITVLENLLLEARNEEEILQFLSEHAFCAWVTHEEDAELNSQKLKSRLPETGDRYAAVGIELHPGGPVFYLRQSRKRRPDSQSK